jgi:hypothetical protein
LNHRGRIEHNSSNQVLGQIDNTIEMKLQIFKILGLLNAAASAAATTAAGAPPIGNLNHAHGTVK